MPALESLRRDLKYALRYFARTPLTSITIVVTLALGIGFSSTVFSVMHALFTRPAPAVPDDPALVKIRGITSARELARGISWPELVAYAKRTETFASVAGWSFGQVVVDAGGGEAAPVTSNAMFVTANYFTVLGVRPTLGRTWGQTAYDDIHSPELMAVISDAFAVELFGEAAQAVGKQIKVNQATVTIAGVAPPRFNGAVQSGAKRRIWMPMSARPVVETVNPAMFTDPNWRVFEAMARLRAGISVGEALPVVRGVAAHIDAEARAITPREWTGTADVVRMRGIVELTRYRQELMPGAIAFSALALLILLVCTTTVNSLLVGGAITRRYETAVRLAMGASRARIIRQLLTEVSLLALTGGALGVWLFSMLGQLTEIAGDGFDVTPDWWTMTFSIGYALVAAVISGLTPALHATKAGVSEVLKDSSAVRKTRLQRTFVVAQIAIAQPLMIVLAAASVSVFMEIPDLTNVARRERMLLVEMDTHLRYSAGVADQVPAVLQRLRETPGVVAALKLGPSRFSTLEAPQVVKDSLRKPLYAEAYDVPPGYFAMLDIPILQGRDFVPGDTLTQPRPVIINRELATRLFGSASPIGKRVRQLAYDTDPQEREVIGVVEMAANNTTLEYPPDFPPMFLPMREGTGATVLVRTTGPANELVPTVLKIARTEARLMPVTRIGTLAGNDRRIRDSRRGVFGVGSLLGVIILSMAAVGLYAMLSLALEQRRREIGIRVALGAHAREVVLMFFRNGLRTTLLGVTIGLPLSVAGLALLRSMLEMKWVTVPVTAVVVLGAVVGVASLASWLPARRAASVDPMLVLRSD
jgi:putative ABC transport system permease protein